MNAMLAVFDDMPDSARVWVFQSRKEVGAEDESRMAESITAFLTTWQAHGKDLEASYRFIDGHFLVIAVDEAGQKATGCSMDGLHRFIGSLQEQGFDFQDRTAACKRGDSVSFFEISKVGDAVRGGEILADDYTYNNSVIDMASFRKAWSLPASESWMRRFF